MSKAIDAAIAHLSQETGTWVEANNCPNLDGYLLYTFEPEQFALAQRIVSGANFSNDLKGSVEFLVAREQRLHEEAKEFQEYTGVYTLGNNYCSSGWGIFQSDGKDILCLWYETTSGTVLLRAFTEEDSGAYYIYLPESRKGGNHNTELDRVKAGMTSEQYDRWYNSYCLGDDRIPDYDEWSKWHNEKMVPLGYQPMISGEQLRIERKLDSALKFLHGDWAQKWGIGKQLNKIINNENRYYQASLVLQELESATQKWRELMKEWETEGNQIEADYDYDEYDLSDE